MKKTNIFYYCNNCKKILTDLEELLFVEESSPRGFCSEDCIETFYQHLVDHFEKIDKNLRIKLILPEEDCLHFVGKPKLMELTLSNPHEVWHFENDINEKYFIFHRECKEKSVKPFTMIVICMVFSNKPSFILSATATRSTELLEHYRQGEKFEVALIEGDSLPKQIDPPENGLQSIEINEEQLEELELKKSQLLANLLEERSPSDIPFERFNIYDDFIEETLNRPDEIYTRRDDEGDNILTYIKAHELNGISFYYFCVCMKLNKDNEEGLETLLPILTFPSLDGEIYEIYKRGEQVTGSLKN